MENKNFDNQIKNQLEQRTIEPSAKSWEQLRSKLDKKDKKPVPVFWWTAIAASFVGGVLLVSVMLNNPSSNQNNAVTEHQVEVIQEPKDLKSSSEPAQIQETVVLQEPTEESNPLTKKVTQEAIDTKTELAEANIQEKEAVQNETYKNEAIDNAIAEVAEQIKHSEITDSEVDALLEAALAELSEKRISRNESISAVELLADVEEEVERSFRERVFELLKDGLNLSRDALANRNQ
jgi:hypothetical protein